MNTLIEATALFLWFLTLVLCTAFVVWAVARMAQSLRRNATREMLRKVVAKDRPVASADLKADYEKVIDALWQRLGYPSKDGGKKSVQSYLDEAIHQAGVSKADIRDIAAGEVNKRVDYMVKRYGSKADPK